MLQLAAIPAIVATIILHELAHGYAALWLGDDTAKAAGRLSLNPLRHVDPLGTLIVPGALLLMQAVAHTQPFLFGWAKPVPVAAWRFPNPRRGMMLVAAAGPAANFLLAWLAALSMHLTALLPDGIGEYADTLAFVFVLSNLVLGLFNLLPIPPLDGGRIVVGLLPEGLAAVWARVERAGIVIVLLLLLMPRALAEFGIRFDPLGDNLERLVQGAVRLVSFLAFHDV